MPHNPPLKLKELKQKGMLDEAKFFSDLADEAGMNDVESVKRVYMAMVRLITKRLVFHFGTRLPHLGDIGVPMFKSRMARVGTKTMKIPERRVIKFYPKITWQKHMSAKLGYRKY